MTYCRRRRRRHLSVSITNRIINQLSACACAAALSPSAQGSGTVAPTVTGTAAPTTSVVKPTNVPTAAANRPAVGVMAGVLGFAAIAL